MDDTDPYPTLLGLDWAIEMGGVININMRSMIFKNGEIRVIIPLDLAEGQGYAKRVRGSKEGDQLYKVSSQTDGMPVKEEINNEYLYD